MHNMDLFHPILITGNNLLLMANTKKITSNFLFLYFEKEVILWTSEDKKGLVSLKL